MTTNTYMTSISPNTNRNSENLTIWSHITSNLLEKWINESNSDLKLIIIDSRDSTDHSKLHIKNSINIPSSKIICQQLKSEKISINELLIKYSNKDLISSNINELNIVVYDHKSEHSNQLDFENSFTILLLKKLAQKFKSVSFLIEGFVNFNRMHPHLCESLQETMPPSTPVKLYPILSVTSEATPSPKESDIIGKPNIFSLKPKQLRLNHSLSSYGIDLNSSSNSAVSSLSSLISENEPKSQFNNLASPTEDTQPLKEPTKILDFLYLGSQEDALSETSMNNLGITCVLNVSITCPKPEFIQDANFLRVPINDGHSAKIIPYFDVAFKFIEKCRKANKKVLIHCLAGISRSPTLAIAYLMKHLNLKSDEAYKFVKEKRKTISPNFNFLGQLYDFEKNLMNNGILNSAKADSQNASSDSACLTYLKFEKISSLSHQQQQHEKFNFSQKKQFIFNFSENKQNFSSLLSPSTAFSNFNLNSPNEPQKQPFLFTKSFTCNSIKEINSTNSQSNLLSKPNVVMRRPTNLSLLNNNQDTTKANINNLKRPSSILLLNNNLIKQVGNTESISLIRTLSNTSSGSTNSSCSTCSSNSNQSCNCNMQKKDFIPDFQNQKKMKLSPIEDRIFLTSPLTPNSMWNTNNIICSFNQKLNNETIKKNKNSKEDLKLAKEDAGISEDDDDVENNENSMFLSSNTMNKSSSSSSSSNKNSLHGSIETMIEVS
ncbi:unnamed protein product [Brachionus calyciflorus]|uniref:protein-tyrosine-phosphatase n=1 Tax=Brachionus calyciflorus TaxID=104777 RepID=A0A813Q530_9BILA|nr:unnamed protein product [Brachionus calyciflorus]